MSAVSVLNNILCIAGIWFWCGWGHLTQEQRGSVMVGTTAGVYTAYFWKSLQDCTSCMLVNQEGRQEVSLGKGKRTLEPDSSCREITNRRCSVSLSWPVESVSQNE